MRETLSELSRSGAAAITACCVTYALTPVVRSLAVRIGWVAKPEEDRWGRRIIARLGGVAMFAGLVAAMLWWVPLQGVVPEFLVGAALVFVLGLADDLRRMPPYTKLIAQLLIGCLVVIGGLRIPVADWPWLSIPLSVLWFVLIMNAFNLLDNMDGLAAGVGAIAAGFCVLHAALAEQWTVAAAAASVSGICLGFLRYNFPPAKIFMGDSGSHLLGLTLAALAVMGNWRRSAHLLSVLAVPALVLAVPIFDTCFVAIQRLAHHQHPFSGGTDHVSHRLAILGLTVRQTVLALYGVSACLGLLSLVSASLRPLASFMIWLVAVTALVLIGRYLGRVHVYRLEDEAQHGRSPAGSRPTTRIETMLLHKRRLVEVLADFSLVSSAYVVAHLLRFEGQLTGDLQHLIMQSLPVILVIKLGCFMGCGLYRGVWRYLGLSDLIAIGKAVTFGSVLSSMALLYLWRFEGYSRAVLIIDWTLSLLAIGASRLVERLLDEWISRAAARDEAVIILGAGDTGARVLRSLRDEGRTRRRVACFLDDDPRKHGDRILGVSVVGDRTALADLLEAYRASEVWIAISDPSGALLQHVQGCCEPRGIAWRVVTAGITAVP